MCGYTGTGTAKWDLEREVQTLAIKLFSTENRLFVGPKINKEGQAFSRVGDKKKHQTNEFKEKEGQMRL